MALAAEDTVVPASVAIQNGTSTDFDMGSLTSTPPLFGVVEAVPGTVTVLWNNGARASGIAKVALREVTVPDSTTLYGQTVQLTGSGPEFRGRVQVVFKLALEGAGDTDPDTDVVAVLTPEGLWFLAKVSDVSAV